MNQIKERIRFTVLDNLRRSGIRDMIQKSGDMDDIRIVLQNQGGVANLLFLTSRFR